MRISDWSSDVCSSDLHDPGSALAIRTQYRQSQSRAARLRLLLATGHDLTQLPLSQMRQRAVQRACAFLAMDHGLLLEWAADSTFRTIASHGSHERLDLLANLRSEEPTSELQSLMRNSYSVFSLKQK